jgi:dTDP-4-amino-4,6-dideoxygalactose transaminase
MPRAESTYDRLVTLPLWPGMSDADVNDVVRAVQRVVAAYRA